MLCEPPRQTQAENEKKSSICDDREAFLRLISETDCSGCRNSNRKPAEIRCSLKQLSMADFSVGMHVSSIMQFGK